MNFTWTDFPDLDAASCQATTAPWAEFVEKKIQHPTVCANKSALPLFKGMTFGGVRSEKQCLRHDGNRGTLFGIEIDYDAGEVSIDEAAKRLTEAGIEAALYATPRNTADKPRWRAVIPLARPHIPEDHTELVALANGALAGIAADESFKPSQSFYIGAVKGVPYQWRHVKGRPIDDGPDLFLTPIYKKGGAPKKYEPSSIDDIPDIVTDECMRDLSAAVLALSVDRSDKYVNWVGVLIHLKHLAWCGRPDEAESLARKFSMRSPKFDDAYFTRKWAGLPTWRGHHKTLFKLATEDGWVNPGTRQGAGLIDMTDAGNVNALAEITNGDLRCIQGRALWLHWAGDGWQEDPAATHATRYALSVAALYKTKAQKQDEEAAGATTSDERKQHQKLADSFRSFSNYCRNKRGIDAMLALAMRDSRFIIPVTALDQNNYLLGVQNGVVDLQTARLRDAARDDHITKRSPCAYDPEAKAPRFMEFIAEVTSQPIEHESDMGSMRYAPRPELAKYAQKAMGYMLTGSTVEHKMFVASGGGANGKSILFDMVCAVMGDYAGQVPCETLMASANNTDAERATPFIRSLAGKRLIVTSEAKEGQKLNTSLVKRQTGDAKLTARGMREDAVTFDVTHKLVLLTNHTPELDHADDAIRGRLHFIPFDRTWNRPGIPNRNPRLPDGDKHLMAKLQAERDGILTWLVQGAAAYLRDGLEPPPEVSKLTNTYLAEQDSFGRWLADMEKCEPKQGTGAADLFNLFKTWCYQNDASLSPSTSTAFGKSLRTRGVQDMRGRSGVVYGLRPPPPPADIF